MNHQVEFYLDKAPIIRDILYGDKRFVDRNACQIRNYSGYISSDKDNINIIKDIITKDRISLVVAPTGAGKSTAILQAAEEIVNSDASCKVILAMPFRAIVEQMEGKTQNVVTLYGGKFFDKDNRFIVCTYEKLPELISYIENNRSKGRYYFVMDESHSLTNSIMYRQEAIQNIISSVEKNLFDSKVFITATPGPMTLFHVEELIVFEDNNQLPAIDNVELIYTDDVLEYIKGTDVRKEFPFIRLNSKNKIDNLINDMPFNISKITSDDKESDVYKDIVENQRLSNVNMDGIVCTSVIEAGVNLTKFPSNIVGIVAIPDVYYDFSIDGIEQFLARVRRTSTNHMKTVKIVLPKLKENNKKTFKPIEDIFSANIKIAEQYQEKLNHFIRVLSENDTEPITDIYEGMDLSDKTIVDVMIQAAISKAGALAPCMTYEHGIVSINKRSVFYISYSQYERQYAFYPDKLKEQLERRLGVPVHISEIDVEKGKKTVTIPEDIWKDCEEEKDFLKNNNVNDICEWILGKKPWPIYIRQSKKWQDGIYSVRQKEHLMQIMGDLYKLRMPEDIIIKVMTMSDKKAQLTKYKNAYKVIINNQSLQKSDEIVIGYKSPEDRLQVSIHSVISKKGVKSFNMNQSLLDEIEKDYQERFKTSEVSKQKMKKLIKKMYKVKDEQAERYYTDMRTNANDIFVII